MSTQYPAHYIIHVLALNNPRKPGTGGATHWSLYRNGMTIAEFKAAKGVYSRLVTDVTRGSLAVLPPGEDPPEYTPRARRTKQKGAASPRPLVSPSDLDGISDYNKKLIESLGVSVKSSGPDWFVRHPKIRHTYDGGNLTFILIQIQMELEYRAR